MKTVSPYISHQTLAKCCLPVIMLLLCPSAILAQSNQRSEFHESYSLSAGGSVGVTNVSGWIRITGWQENKVQVDAVKRARRSEDLDKVEIQVSASASRVEIRTVYPRHSSSSVSVDYEIKVPQSAILNNAVSTSGDIAISGIRANVTARSTSGNITVRNLGSDGMLSTTSGDITAEDTGGTLTINSTSGNVRAHHIAAQFRSHNASGTVQVEDIRDDADISTTSGNVTLTKAGGRVNVRSTSGTVTVKDVSGDVNVETTSDSVTVANIKGRVAATSVSGDLIIQNAGEGFRGSSVSGNMQISGVQGRIECGSTSGDIVIQNSVSDEIRVRTHSGDVGFHGEISGNGQYDFTSFSGDILLQLPSGSNFNILAKTSSGDFETDFPLKIETEGGASGRGRRVQATHGRGGARIELTGFSANLRIKKQ